MPEKSPDFSKVIWIKTNNTFWQGTTGKSAKVAHCKMSLVDGNVTVGGGKATTTKTYRHQVLRGTKQNVQTIWMLTGDIVRRERLRNTKSAMSRVRI